MTGFREPRTKRETGFRVRGRELVNIKNVADRAGVSIATVSHVLNQTRRVRPETAARVRTAIEELGYSQNLAARNLATGRSNILGLIVSDIQNPHFPELTRNFQDQALLHNMEVLVMNTGYDPQRTSDCVRRLIGLRVPGLAIMTTEYDTGLVELVARQNIRAVYYFNPGPLSPLISCILVNYGEGIREAVNHLEELGHRQIAFIGGAPHLQSAMYRRQAFIEQMQARGEGATRIVDADFSAEGGYYGCSRLLSSAPPTAIVCANDLMAFGAMHCCRDKGLRIPQDISIVGFDNISFSQYSHPPLTTVAIPRDKLGQLAFKALWEMINRQTSEGRVIQLGTRLLVRESTAPPRKN